MNSRLNIQPASKHLAKRLRTAALLGLICLSAAAPTFAAFVTLDPATDEIPGLQLGTGTAGVTGIVIDAQDSLFNLSSDFQGVLRSMVVDTGLGYDFYYQVVNTGTDPGTGAEIFRMKTLGGFDGLTLSVTYRTDLTGLDVTNFPTGPAGGAGAYTAGTKSVYSADRDQGTSGSVGFDFSPSHFLFDPANIQPGQTSMIAVVRTSISSYTTVNADVSGNNTARIASFAPVPEPQAAVLIALGIAVLARSRTKRW